MAAGDLNTGAGSIISIGGQSDTLPLASSPDPWNRIGRISTSSAVGPSYANIDWNDLDGRLVEHFKGVRDDGVMELTVGHEVTDTGQGDLLDALDSDDLYAFRIELNNSSGASGAHGDRYTFLARVMSYQLGAINNQSVVTASVRLGIKSGTFSLEEPAT